MSVWTTALFSHNWSSISESMVEEIAQMISSEKATAKWRQHSTFKSPAEEFVAEGTVLFFLPENFAIGIGKKIVNLEYADRWSKFLLNEILRHQFVTACTKIAGYTGAQEILLLPEGTTLMDQFYSGAAFEEVKLVAMQQWGHPTWI